MRARTLALCGISSLFALNLTIHSSLLKAAIQAPTNSNIPMATLRGKIGFQGNIPAATAINAAADPACRVSLSSETVRVSNQGLENVMVYVSSPVAGAPAPDGSTVLLEHRDCRYEPHVVTLQVGQPLLIRNSDQTLSNTHAFTQVNSAFNTGQPVPMTTTHVFDKPEVPIPVKDDVHRWKTAYIGVFSHPYHTVSKQGGLYELHLPAGNYEITAWHEKYGMSTLSVILRPGENAPLDFLFTEK